VGRAHTCLNPLLSEAGFSTGARALADWKERHRLNPLLSEAGFSTNILVSLAGDVLYGLNPLLSEAGFSTPINPPRSPGSPPS